VFSLISGSYLKYLDYCMAQQTNGAQTLTHLVGLPGRRTGLSQGILQRTTQTQNNVPSVGFKLITPVFEQYKIVNVLNRAAIVTG
jgi:hypothetical protein